MLKAITIREPWCSAVADGHKPVENRRRGFPHRHRGLVILHASLGWSDRGLTDERIHEAYAANPPAMLDRARASMGCAIGHANLADVHPDVGCCRPWGESEYEENNGTRRADLVHLVFENAVRWEHPIPARGKLGLWVVGPELEAASCA